MPMRHQAMCTAEQYKTHGQKRGGVNIVMNVVRAHVPTRKQGLNMKLSRAIVWS